MVKYKNMGNPVGSSSANFCNFLSNEKDAFILGLWCADCYWWSSSIGLSNTDNDLIDVFRQFFKRFFAEERIKFNRNHIFVNSRPLLREFRNAENNLEKLKKPEIISAYFAGRFDGDGSVDKNMRSDGRIEYSNKKKAELDQKLLFKIGIKNTKVYYYQSAMTHCLYISRYEAKKFLDKISKYSIKLQKLALLPRRDLALTEKAREL